MADPFFIEAISAHRQRCGTMNGELMVGRQHVSGRTFAFTFRNSGKLQFR
jgi:hypothetical protein